MKTSSKILIGLLSTILIVMMAFFIDIRVFGEHRSERMNERKTENFPVGDFKHVHVDDFKSFKIIHSDKKYIEIVVFNDTTDVKLDYSINNDTLIIIGNSLPSFASYTLFTNEEIESILANNSKIRISGFNQECISINVIDGSIGSIGSKKGEFSNFDKAVISGLNSWIKMWDDKIDSLEINIENSKAEFRKEVNTVNASIKSESQLNLKNVEKLELTKDKTSRIYIR